MVGRYLPPKSEVLAEANIVTSVVVGEEEVSCDEEEVMEVPKVRLFTLLTYIHALVDYSSFSQLPKVAHHYGNLQLIRKFIIKEQHMAGCQTNISNFFGPCPIQDGAPASHFPSLMGTSPAPEDQTNAGPCCYYSTITPGDDVQDADCAELMLILNSD